MSYVLSIIRPPVAPAAYGEAVVSVPRPSQLSAAEFAVNQLCLDGVARVEASRFVRIWKESLQPGVEVTHGPSGLVFRIDPADIPPNVCPCCARLVKPGDGMFAGMDDALCDGCYTWPRNTPQCLPANTAHTEEP